MNSFRDFLKLESASGIFLLFAAGLALILNNSPLSKLYDDLLLVPFEIRLGQLQLAKPLLLWINDGLMAVFFLLVGLEIKREILEGELSRLRKAALPIYAALGGMAAPALIFAAINWGEPTVRGWAIPAATDIAFALGILGLLSSRVPVSLKIFLTAVAILDDLGAIVIISIFYTENLSLPALCLGFGCSAVLGILNRTRVQAYTPYILVGLLLWVCVLKSGVHATLAGVIVAFAIPLRSPDGQRSPLKELEHALHPWVAFMVMPIFAFANAGVELSGLSWTDLFQPLPLGIAAGLFVGKQVGVFACTWLPIRLGLASRPRGCTMRHLYGASLLAGIGFTMSLFIGTLAFDDPESARGVRLGVLTASCLSGVLGYVVLRGAAA
ncbi:MAG: Na+/H+ antiporter NhaA, partial [Planctomycetota bacterium]